MEKLPYIAEYAKSNRSSCKACKMGIGKDSLRLGIMVQSPRFDGVIPNWYHKNCFFRKSRPKNCNEIDHFDQLRWDDQKSIKAIIEGGAVQGDTNGGGGGSSIKLDSKVEYAKSGRSKCRSCNELIEKAVIRISVKDFDSDDAKRYGPLDRWFHVPCFEKEKDDLDLPDHFDVTKVDGFKFLADDDRADLKKRFKVSGAGKKRKHENEAPPAAKKAKKETEEEKGLREQSELLWKVRDKLESEVSTDALKGLLEYNNQKVPTASYILERLSDAMLFGPLKPCPECQGQVVYSAISYHCTGQMTEWTKCLYRTREPKRGKFRIPEEYCDVDFLKNFKFKKRQRLFPFDAETAAGLSQPSVASSSDQKKATDKPLKGMRFVVAKTTYPSGKSKEELEENLQALGAKIIKAVDKKTAAVIGTKELVDKRKLKLIQKAEEDDVHVVKEEFVEEVSKGGAALLIQSFAVSSWGSDPVLRIGETPSKSGSVLHKGSAESRFKAELSKVKMKVKGGAAVDPESGLEDSAHVMKGSDQDPLNAVLGNVDLVRGSNSYYKLQVLESDKKSRWYVFRAWGRIGTTIGGTKLETFHSKLDATEQFFILYEDKTGNSWKDRKTSGKIANKFFPLDMDYGDDDEKLGKLDVTNSSSGLDKSVQTLIQFIFDIDSMKQTMKEFEIDLKKMPLGKLSRNQIEKAYKVLTELNGLISSDGSPTMVLDASTRFYTLIPHDFGMQKPPLLDTLEVIKSKTEMLDSLLEIEIAYSLMKTGAEEDPVDAYYKKLNTEIEPLDKDSDEYKRLVTYVNNTHAPTHTQYKVEVEDIFLMKRAGEAARYKPFKKLPNRRLLWHGSRRTNWAGIISQGLRIAPPEAPVTGYMFGKGVYFADMVTKSANYCFTNPANSQGIMLLCEVALGNMTERTRADPNIKLQPEEHSCYGRGRTMPNPEGNYTNPDGVVYPLGQHMQVTNVNSSLLYNEFIVYDVAQVEQRYLFRMNFNYNYRR